MADVSIKPIAIADLMHRTAPRKQVWTAAAFVAIILLITLVAAHSRDQQEPAIRPFVPICATLWGTADLLTAYLLLTQFRVNGIRAFAVLGAAYTVPGLLTIAYTAYFPGLFLATPVPPGLEQVSVWFWIVWHVVFAAIVAVYHIVDRRLDARLLNDGAIVRAFTISIGASVAGSAAIIALIVHFQSLLPVMVVGGRFAPLYGEVIAPTIVIVNVLAAAIILILSNRPSTLQIWLMVALLTAAFDAGLNAFASGRYTLNWYIGKLETLSTATAVLVVLLAEVSELYRRLGSLATIDVLTGLANRQSFDSDARWALQVGARQELSVAFLVIDIDHFKRYNDTYGHQAGDACLRQVAQSIRLSCGRAADLVGRYGGEEFVVLLAATTEDGANRVAETIRSGIEMLGLPHAASPVAPVVTVSIGGVVDGAGRMSLEELFRSADAELYRAKVKRNTLALAAAPIQRDAAPSMESIVAQSQ